MRRPTQFAKLGQILGLEKWEDEAAVTHVAADSDCYEICEVLSDEIKVDLDVVGGHWGTALQAAAAFGHEKIVRLCLSSGADFEAKAGYFHTALHARSYNSHKSVTRILLEAEADANAQSDSVGTVLYEAERREQCSSMLNLLRQHGAEDLPPIELCVEVETDSDEWNWEEIAHLAEYRSETILKYRTGTSRFGF
jgi:hypothetical protein